ncbi:MAG TPA: hypothetical protein VGY66_34705 [Gemmataceae bacterium]|nr:hypothetical protein [Gemmataceae bacterium]
MLAESIGASDREQRLSAVVLSCLEALDRGRTLDRQELLARYPEFAADWASSWKITCRWTGVPRPCASWASISPWLDGTPLRRSPPGRRSATFAFSAR